MVHAPQATVADHEVGNLSGLRAHDNVLDAAEGVIAAVDDTRTDQLIGSIDNIRAVHSDRGLDLFAPPGRYVRRGNLSVTQFGDISLVRVACGAEHALAGNLLAILREDPRGGEHRSYFVAGPRMQVAVRFGIALAVAVSVPIDRIAISVATAVKPIAILLLHAVEGSGHQTGVAVACGAVKSTG